ncbi:MAG: CmcI family methyltransferase, partial [Pseudomonadota bacterium]
MDPIRQFEKERHARIEQQQSDADFQKLSQSWLLDSMARQYVYNFEWMGRPIIQYPQDMVAVQELIWSVKPDVIIETGIAHGGSLILSASMLALLDYCEALAEGTLLDPSNPKRYVVGVDIDIREHNLKSLQSHPMANRLHLLEGSSIDAATVGRVTDLV